MPTLRPRLPLFVASLLCIVSLPLCSPQVHAAKIDTAVAALAKEVQTKGWIAYSARSPQGDWDVFLMRPDGSSVRNLTNTPASNEFYPLFSRDGHKLLYRRLPRSASISGNDHGAQGVPVLANSDGSNPRPLGGDGALPWASWSPDGSEFACLSLKGIQICDAATGAVKRTLPRQGFFQQMTWSPDGRFLSGVSNSFGTSWSVGRLNLETGAANAVSRVDNCTPDWFPDSARLVFSNRPAQPGQNGGQGWTQLWMAGADGTDPRLIYAENGRHIYGGQVSPDGLHVIFTGNPQEDGDPENRGAPMAIVRLSDTPMLGGDDPALSKLHPKASRGPVLPLPTGWEPCWTASETPAGAKAP